MAVADDPIGVERVMGMATAADGQPRSMFAVLMVVTTPLVLFALVFGSDWLDQALEARHPSPGADIRDQRQSLA